MHITFLLNDNTLVSVSNTPIPLHIPSTATAVELNTELLTQTLALDCEMVGVGHSGKVLKLARVSLVNDTGDVVLDTYVQPDEPVTRFSPALNGITAAHMAIGVRHHVVERMLFDVLSGRTVVGHSLQGDFSVIFGRDRRALPPK